MADIIPDHGLDEWRYFGDGATDFEWLLLDESYVPDPADRFVSEVTAYELGGVGYVRPLVDTPVREVDTTAHRINYRSFTPDFGSVAAGESFRWLVLDKRVTTDADSPLVGVWDLGANDTQGIPVRPQVALDGVIHYLDQAA